jgi:hypothetical protein
VADGGVLGGGGGVEEEAVKMKDGNENEWGLEIGGFSFSLIVD